MVDSTRKSEIHQGFKETQTWTFGLGGNFRFVLGGGGGGGMRGEKSVSKLYRSFWFQPANTQQQNTSKLHTQVRNSYELKFFHIRHFIPFFSIFLKRKF